jgi:hypothetical protein
MTHLSCEFARKDLCHISYFMGISVTRHSSGLFLSQHKYAEEIIERDAMSFCKPISNPIDTKAKLNGLSGKPYHNPSEYQSLAGDLQYLTFTRSDITYAIQQVCLYMHYPRTQHMTTLKRIIRYFKDTIHHGLHLSPSLVYTHTTYTYVDRGEWLNIRKSTSGYCVYLGNNLISWFAKQQSNLSCSSAEAEYRSVANVVVESCWLQNLLSELQCLIIKSTLVCCDNVSIVYMSSNPIQHKRTKHVEMDIHFVREKVAKGQVHVLHVPSRNQIDEIFTNGLSLQLFDDFRDSHNTHQPPVLTTGTY